MSDVKPWSMGTGALIGAVIGGIVWWTTYEPGAGLFQRPQIILVPAASGIFIVCVRNWRKKIGAWDPKNREPQP